MKRCLTMLTVCIALLASMLCGCSNSTGTDGPSPGATNTGAPDTDACQHLWNAKTGKCAECGVDCEHTWDVDYCLVCSMTCEHTAHDKTTENCVLCGYNVRHTYQDGICEYCGNSIPYTSAVSVEGGQIRGYVNGSGTVNIYKGIPYAASTGGENRWRSPKPVPEWNGVRDCIEFGDACMQRPPSVFSGYTAADLSEDCLSLNVWAPANKTNCPVLVFIHGGGNVSGGSASWDMDGESFAKEGIVYVSVNYRLGIFGFLATEELVDENDGAGNFAILDLVKSLEWIRDYISEFGGDPNNVTISGQSAGAQNVQMLTITPKAKGLFKNAIAMSGPGLGTMRTIEAAIASNTTRIAMGGDGKPLSDYTLAELREMDAASLVPYMLNHDWGYCVDGDNFTAGYTDAYENGTANDVNILVGMVSGDTATFGSDDGENTPEKILMTQMNSVAAARTKAVTNHNFSGKTYVYYIDHCPPNAAEMYHGGDIQYFFKNLALQIQNARKWTQEDFAVSDAMFAYVVNFVKTGNPNGEGLTSWTENTGNGAYLHLDAPGEMRKID